MKKRSRKTVKHQRGIVGADLSAITARRNQTAAERETARAAAIAKAKAEKKKKEDAKTKAKVGSIGLDEVRVVNGCAAGRAGTDGRTQGVEAADEGRKGRTMRSCVLCFLCIHLPVCNVSMSHIHDCDLCVIGARAREWSPKAEELSGLDNDA